VQFERNGVKPTIIAAGFLVRPHAYDCFCTYVLVLNRMVNILVTYEV